MQQHSNLLNLLIDFLAIDIPQSAERETKINEIKKSALTREQKTIFYMQDYNISKNPFSLNPNNFTVCNKTHDYLNIIICDEVICIPKKQPSMCDYLIEKNDNSRDLLLLCEIKNIQQKYYEETVEQAKNQILSTYNILSQSNCLSNYNCGVIGLTSIIEGSYMQKAFKKFTKSPTNKKYRNKCIYLHIKNTSIKTFITNKINIKNNKPFIDYDKYC